MSENTEELSSENGTNPDDLSTAEGTVNVSTTEGEQQNLPSNSGNVPEADNLTQSGEVEADNLLELPPEKLAGMVRDKRKAEASVRTKLRDAEAERDQLATAVKGFRTQAFAAAAKSTQLQSTAVEDALKVVPLEGMLTEDGTIDAAKVKESMQALRRSHPHYFQPVPPSSGPGFSGGPDPSDLNGTAGWSEILHR
ncbi:MULTISPECIES: hypothetical protein [Brevibacterium]|uniref:Phage minor structural protein GP20 n=1 Tax=Brevibacterium antiquum CNRZ 918 TaxID=1255637 RepID=A0A2H1J2R4_9MICO|nr:MULTISPECIES: hypothetical protein [Brevibacterium]SMX81703.1 hypothetical protein BANT918_01364 [Brevibacterium antiquum CNRZ 918]HCG56413.1 hypothetical protein [Brevibacterium sp.]